MNESGIAIRQKHYTRIIVPTLKKDTISPTDRSREWGTLIETINAIGKALKAFFIIKSESVFEDHEKFIEKSGHTVAIFTNGWSNIKLAIAYLNHFIKHTSTQRIGEYILLILDGHDSHSTIKFRQLAINNKIIFLYFFAYSTHKL